MDIAPRPSAGKPRTFSAMLCLALLSSAGCRSEPEPSSAPIPPSHTLRIVRPKQFTALQALEKHGSLEKTLLPLGFSVQWLEFAAGPQQLEALGADALDIASTAESPPIFAQAAGTRSCIWLPFRRAAEPSRCSFPPLRPRRRSAI